MLVLSRKIDEQIVIGDNIKITLVRVKGNTVRIGIEAPNDVRILRGELERRDQDQIDAEASQTIDGMATVFAHPETNSEVFVNKTPSKKKPSFGTNRITDVPATPQVPVTPKVLVGRFDANGEGQLRDAAPLSGYMSAT